MLASGRLWQSLDSLISHFVVLFRESRVLGSWKFPVDFSDGVDHWVMDQCVCHDSWNTKALPLSEPHGSQGRQLHRPEKLYFEVVATRPRDRPLVCKRR